MPSLYGCGCLVVSHTNELHKECKVHADLRAELAAAKAGMPSWVARLRLDNSIAAETISALHAELAATKAERDHLDQQMTTMCDQHRDDLRELNDELAAAKVAQKMRGEC
jgi:hypothetical protein